MGRRRQEQLQVKDPLGAHMICCVPSPINVYPGAEAPERRPCLAPRPWGLAQPWVPSSWELGVGSLPEMSPILGRRIAGLDPGGPPVGVCVTNGHGVPPGTGCWCSVDLILVIPALTEGRREPFAVGAQGGRASPGGLGRHLARVCILVQGRAGPGQAFSSLSPSDGQQWGPGHGVSICEEGGRRAEPRPRPHCPADHLTPHLNLSQADDLTYNLRDAVSQGQTTCCPWPVGWPFPNKPSFPKEPTGPSTLPCSLPIPTARCTGDFAPGKEEASVHSANSLSSPFCPPLPRGPSRSLE